MFVFSFRPQSSSGKGNDVFCFIGGLVVGTLFALILVRGPMVMAKLKRRTGNVSDNTGNQSQDSQGSDFNASSMASSDSTFSEEKVDITQQPYLLLNRLIHKGEVAAIISASSIGKTFLAIQVAKNSDSGKVLYLDLDDFTGKQEFRYNAIPAATIITRKGWDEGLAQLRDCYEKKCGLKAIYDVINTSRRHHGQERKTHVKVRN
jgi:hypothetical protein